MNDLLKNAIEAHGGSNAWNKLQSLLANVSIGGALLGSEGIDERIVFRPDQISLESDAGKILDTRSDPRSAFAGHSADSKWDKLHAGYFCICALGIPHYTVPLHLPGLRGTGD
jgi:hypothetical protein